MEVAVAGCSRFNDLDRCRMQRSRCGGLTIACRTSGEGIATHYICILTGDNERLHTQVKESVGTSSSTCSENHNAEFSD